MRGRPVRRPGGPGRRTRPIRRSSAGLGSVRAGAILALLVSGGGIYGLASSSAFAYETLRIEGTSIVSEATVRERLELAQGVNLFTIQTEPLEERLRAIPAVGGADVSVALPDAIVVRLDERRPLLVWRSGEHSWYVDATGSVFAEVGDDPPEAAAELPVVIDARAVALGLRVGSTIDPVDLDAATRLASLTPAQVGSAAAGLSVGVTDDNGFVLSSVPKSWVAVFGFYGLSLRTTDLIPGQVQLLGSLLAEAGEATVGLVILSTDRDGTYFPKVSPSPSPSIAP
ncbi:MAG TPA: FtsQ-type POTRA domain-containing protein [Candidatus Limnocylindrales bacterium]|nr:FtsQ-type POTRA domain-containing protein [Candidatus Limnocylindrales bacterium]